MPARLDDLDRMIVDCRRCPRLVEWRELVARERRASYADQDYWGRPVPGFGVAGPRIWIVGLAPAAHGANRTGRMFTGDRSGDWLFAALHRVGLASQPTSVSRDDGQQVTDLRITAAVHCAPPANRPTREEFGQCAHWLHEELRIVTPSLRAIIALGGLAWDSVLGAVRAQGWTVPRPKPRFGHAAQVMLNAPGGTVPLLGCYHPSQQNTFTGRLTEPMLDAVLARARQVAGE